MKTKLKVSSFPKDAKYDLMDSPVGELVIVVSPKGLHAILWDRDEGKEIKSLQRTKTDKVILETKKQLREYFSGKRKTFDLPLVVKGTEFQMQAWKQLQKIPYAKTVSYGEQAARIGDKKKCRAVGAANGSNPISIVIPCHRVIGSNGKLVGFGGGLDRKAFLLELERKWNQV